VSDWQTSAVLAAASACWSRRASLRSGLTAIRYCALVGCPECCGWSAAVVVVAIVVCGMIERFGSERSSWFEQPT